MRAILKPQRPAIIILSFLLLLMVQSAIAAETISATAVVESTEVYIGEPFIFQIEVKGHSQPGKPDTSVIKDFTVQSLGGRVNSSSSITIINGKTNAITKRGYTFSYRLTPTRSGKPVIPPIKIKVGGKTVSTQPIMMHTVKPSESSDVKLRFKLSNDKCYVGQPVTLTVIWYIARDVQNFYFNLPVITDQRFTVIDIEEKVDPSRPHIYQEVNLDDGVVIAKKTKKMLDGKEYTAVIFKKVLIPNTPGELKIPGGTIACDAVMGYKRRQGRRRPSSSLFDDSFFFRGSRQAVIEKIVASSNEPVLQVLPLPERGKPDRFSGLIGNYTMVAVADPTEVRVGEPITLTIEVAGPEYMENVVLPPLYLQPSLAQDFKVPVEMAPGKVEGRVKTFTQTIRAKNAEVREIPPIELPFFNARSGKYGVAKTEPIPIVVSATRIVTAMDAEGRAIYGDASSELETWVAGIAHNYEDPSILNSQNYGPEILMRSTALRILICLPLLVYIVLLAATTIIHRRNADPAAQLAKRAYSALSVELKKIRGSLSNNPADGFTLVLEALQKYLGAKLNLPAAALTFREVEAKLTSRGIDAQTLQSLRSIFDECEASRYSGGAGIEATGKDIDGKILALARELERRLK